MLHWNANDRNSKEHNDPFRSRPSKQNSYSFSWGRQQVVVLQGTGIYTLWKLQIIPHPHLNLPMYQSMLWAGTRWWTTSLWPVLFQCMIASTGLEVMLTNMSYGMVVTLWAGSKPACTVLAYSLFKFRSPQTICFCHSSVITPAWILHRRC